MAAASRGSVPAVPPRNIPPPIPNRLNVPARRSPRASPTPRDQPDRRSLDISSLIASPNHQRSRSDVSSGSASAPTGNVAHACSVHQGNQCTIVCSTCIELLCNECVTPENNKHSGCSLTYIGDNAGSICEQVKDSLTRKMDTTRVCVGDLLNTLTRKKDRMVAKKDETVSEIDRFYQRLKAKLLSKLQREQTELLNYLHTTVAVQVTSLTDKIQQCSKLIHDVQEKSAMVENLDKLYGTSNNASAYLSSLLSTAAEVKQGGGKINEITAARDAFLVIRFIINPESEQAIANTKVASVEVLDSRSSSPAAENMESERINVCNNTGAESSGSVESIDAIDNAAEEITSRASAMAQSRRGLTSPLVSSGTSANEDSADRGSQDTAPSTYNRPTSSQPTPTVTISRRSGDSNSGSSTSNSGSDSDDEEPPPPYPGLPEHVLTNSTPSRSETPPPPYPGPPPPPMYVQLPEPQQPLASPQQQTRPQLPSYQQARAHTPSQQQTRPQAPPYRQAVERSSRRRQRLNARSDNLTPTPLTIALRTPSPRPISPRPLSPRPVSPRTHSSRPLSPRPLSPRPISPTTPGSTNAPQQAAASIPITPPSSPTENNTQPSINRPRGPLKSFSVNEISDKRSSGIFSIAVYNNNSFLVIDRWNRKLKYFSDQGESLGGVIFREEPWDITEVSGELFAVTVPKLCTIYKIKASRDTVVTVGNISTMKKYACIAYNDGKFICGQVPQFGEPCVDVIKETGGPVIHSFRNDTLGGDLFSYPRYLKVTQNGTVVVCDWNRKCLIMFRLDGTVVGRYRGNQEFVLKEPTGIELDRERNMVYVIDSKQSSSSGAVQKVSLGCQCQEVYRGQNDFRDARAVAVYGQYRMAIGSKNGILSIFSTRARYR